MNERLKTLIHNLIIHPIAGIFWVLGFEDAGEAIHEICMPDDEQVKISINDEPAGRVSQAYALTSITGIVRRSADCWDDDDEDDEDDEDDWSDL